MTGVTLFLSILFLLDGCDVEQNVSPFFPCTKKMENQYGVCAHITRKGCDWEINASEVKHIRNSGAKIVRSDFDYINVDNKFHFNWLDSVTCNLKKNNMDLLGIVSHPYKSDPWVNYPAFQSYINSFVGHFGKVVRYWEIINEIDLTLKNVDSLDVKYVNLLNYAYSTIKNNNAKNQVLLSGISNVKKGLLERLCKQKVFEYFDIMNFHTYDKPEDLPSHFKYIKKCMDEYGWKKPVWITELGCHTCNVRDKNKTEDYQARTVARYHKISFAYGVDKVFWYNFRSFEKDDKDPESHFGLTHKDLSAKPGIFAYQTLTRLCPSGSTRPLLWKRGELYMSSWKHPDRKRVWAIWVEKGAKIIDFEIKGKYELYNYLGEKLENVPVISTGVTYVVGAKNVIIK